MSAVDVKKLSLPIGEAMFTQRSVRRLKPDPVPMELIHLVLEAAVKAPNGGNRQPGRFLVVTDRAKIKEFAKLYHEAWWAKRTEEKGWTKRSDIPADDKNYQSASGLADEMADVPAVFFASRSRAAAPTRSSPRARISCSRLTPSASARSRPRCIRP
jgi:nitroreductase